MFRDNFEAVTWTCHICKEERPDEKIAVRKKPVIGLNGIPSRIFSENVRYCVDKPSCSDKSRSFSFLRNWSGDDS